MKLIDITRGARQAKSIRIRRRLKAKKHNPPNVDGPVSFHAHNDRGYGGELLNPDTGSV